MAGDYNLDLLKYNTHSATGIFLNNMLSHSLFPTIRHPTRFSEKSSTLLDNIFVNSIQYDVTSAIIYSDISDHLPVAIYLKINLVKKSANHFANRVYDTKSIKKIDTYLGQLDWSCVYILIADTGDASAAYGSFIDTYSIALDLYFPIRKLKNSNRMTPRHVWMTKGLMKACIKKSRLYKIYRRVSTIKNRDKYIFL